MIQKPNISIIIPVYNTSKYLRKTFDSILSQTYKEWELIAVDDGSTVNIGIICDEYAWIRCQQASDISIFNQKESIVAMLLPNSFHGWPVNKMYKTSIIKKHKLRFDESLKYCEDEVFVLKYIMCINKCVYIPDALYHYVQNEDSANNSIYTTRKFNYACLDRHKADEANLITIKQLNDYALEKAFKARMFDSFLATSDKLKSYYNVEKDVRRFITLKVSDTGNLTYII